MYTLVRRFIKTGVAFLAAGLAMGVYVIVGRELLGRWPNAYLVSAHVHAIQAGFVMFMIFGVALWLFPRPAKEDPRYSPLRAEAAYWILALSTGARVAGEAWRGWDGPEMLRWAVVLGGVGQAVGVLVFFWTIWGRIRPVGSQIREARGERF
jgi:heme/copper-type cytochrome/quinol oxidase subunit 1